MAKKPNQEEANQKATVDTSSSSSSGWKHFRLQKPGSGNDKLNNRSVKIAALIATLLILAVFAWVTTDPLDRLSDSTDSEEAFNIEGVSFSEDDIAPYIDGAREVGIDPEIMRQAIEEGLTFKVLADEYGVEISDDLIRETIEKYDSYDPELVETNAWVRLVGFRLAMEDQIMESPEGEARGYAFIFYFGTLADDYVPPEEMGESLPEEVESRLGDEGAIAADREYAREQAEYYHSELTAGNITADEALEAIRNDNRLVHNYHDNPELSYSLQFGYSDELSWDAELWLLNAREFVQQYDEIDNYSDINLGKLNYIEAEGEYDAYYYFVYLEESVGPLSAIANRIVELGIVTPW